MANSTPQLEVFCIDIPTEQVEEVKKKVVPKVELVNPIKEKAFPIKIEKEEIVVVPKEKTKYEKAEMTLGGAVKSVKRFIDENKFHIIDSEEELAEYENALNNEWIYSNKLLKQKQYYIRHPKKGNNNLLIEAGSFYDYIYEEYCRELINYCTSHCNAKKIQINKKEISNLKAKMNASTVNANVAYSKRRGNVFDLFNPSGSKKTRPFDHYYWLEPKIMQGIDSLTKGGHLGTSDELDYTFGVDASEAKAIGLNMKMRKQYEFTIYIEC